jgi:hypothetical protein
VKSTEDVKASVKGSDLVADRLRVAGPGRAVESAQRREQAAVRGVEVETRREFVGVARESAADTADLVLDVAAARDAAVAARTSTKSDVERVAAACARGRGLAAVNVPYFRRRTGARAVRVLPRNNGEGVRSRWRCGASGSKSADRRGGRRLREAREPGPERASHARAARF